jgi:hypothetical protein
MKRLRLVIAFVLAGGVLPTPRPPIPPLSMAAISRQNVPGGHVAVGPDSGAARRLPPFDFEVCGDAAGYAPNCASVPLRADLTVTSRLSAQPLPPVVQRAPAVRWPPTLPRSGLPPFPPITASQPANAGVWSDKAFETTLSFTPPDHPDLDFHRGNFSGVRVPGLQWHGYGTDKDPTLVMTWDQPRRSVEEQKLVLHQYAEIDGYTHFLLSIPQARKAGVSREDFTAAAVLAKSYGQFVIVVAMGGDGEDFVRDVQPWLDTLVALHAVDEVNTAWQGDKWYSPFDLVSLTVQIGKYAHARGLKVSQHWINDAAAWWTPADSTDRDSTCTKWQICDRFSYHRVIAQWVDYQYFQGDHNAPIGAIQGALARVLQSLTTEKLVIAEDDAQAEFNDPVHRTEEQGDLKGLLLMFSKGFGKAMFGGYLNGARLATGGVL